MALAAGGVPDAEGGQPGALIPAAGDGLIVVDASGRIASWNREATEIFRVSREDAVGWPVVSVIPAWARMVWPAGPHSGEGALADGRAALIGIRGDGTEVPIEVSFTSWSMPEGEYFAATVRAGLRVEQAGDVRPHLAEMVDAMPQLVAIAGTDGVVWSLNQAGRRMLGLADEDLRGALVADLYPESERPLIQDEAIPAALTVGSWSGETALLSAQGSTVPVSQAIVAHLPRGGTPGLLCIIAHDLSDSRRLEEELRQSQKMEAVGRLAAGLAHDFNNLLMPILGYGGLLLDGRGSEEERRRYAEQIVRIADRASTLPRQLLTFSRRQVLQPQALNLNAIVNELEGMLRHLIGEKIRVVTQTQPSLGWVKADRAQVEQVLLNLAVNARDAMPGGGTLSLKTDNATLDHAYARRHPDLTPGRYVMLAVSDTGCGMAPETQARIFEPFYTTKAEGKGTGLGLSTAYGIVRQSGGHIHVYSELDKGSVFRIYLPEVGRDAVTPEAQAHPAPARVCSETILVVDDEDTVREAIALVLEHVGYQVLAAGSAEDALEACEGYEGNVDLVVTDMVLPGMDGRGLVEQLVSRSPATRVLYMSGYTDDAIVRQGILEPGVAYLEKPFPPSTLLPILRQLLDSEEAQRLQA